MEIYYRNCLNLSKFMNICVDFEWISCAWMNQFNEKKKWLTNIWRSSNFFCDVYIVWIFFYTFPRKWKFESILFGCLFLKLLSIATGRGPRHYCIFLAFLFIPQADCCHVKRLSGILMDFINFTWSLIHIFFFILVPVYDFCQCTAKAIP